MTGRSRIPIVTLILIAANITAAFWILFSPELIYDFGFKSARPSVQTAFTSLFLHANILHLLGNMVFLAAVGAAVELATGSFRFASVYFLSGLTGVAMHYLMVRSVPSSIPFIGASGAVAGCAAYYAVRYTALRVPLAPKIGVSVALVTVLWLILQIVGAFVRLGDAAGTSFWSHIGGFLAGMTISFVFRAPDLGQTKLGHEVLEQMNLRGPAAVAHAARLHLKTHAEDPRAWKELGDACEALEDIEGETEARLRLLEIGDEEAKVQSLIRLCEMGTLRVLPTIRRMQLSDIYKVSHPSLCRDLLVSIIEGLEDVQRPEAMLALAALERERNPKGASEWLMALQEQYPLHPAVDLARKRGWLA